MCGIIGMIDKDGPAFELAVIGLMSLQHRGQDACGLVTSSEQGLHSKKALDAVHKVFTLDDAEELPGTISIGHTRYATQGEPKLQDAQPLVHKNVALAQNGNVVNYFSLKRKLKEEGVKLATTVDTELMLHVFSEAYEKGQDFFAAAQEVLERIKGGYSIVGLIDGKGLFAIRDPHGIRPLVLGRNGSSYIISSETVAFQATGAEFVREIEPGEAVFIDTGLKLEHRILKQERRAHCMFEWVYFASPNSMMEGRSIYKARLALGKMTGKHIMTEDVDVVLPVPDSGRTAAIKLAESQHIRYREGLIRDRRTARTFIMSSQKAREKAVDQKLRPIIATVQGKSVAIVDDSIVRGTTSKRIIESLRRSGAEEVTFISTCPPIRYPCYYGIDFTSNEELVAHGKTIDEIKEYINADSLVYNTVEDLQRAIKRPLCTACLTGEYPEPVSAEEQGLIRSQRSAVHDALDEKRAPSSAKPEGSGKIETGKTEKGKRAEKGKTEGMEGSGTGKTEAERTGKIDVLLLGGGGREHALALKLAESSRLGKLYAAPGNPGIGAVAELVELDTADNKAVVAFCERNGIGLVVVGPEAPLVNGITDDLAAAGIKAFGPGKAGAQFEGSKGFSRRFMATHGLPSVSFAEFTDPDEAAAYIRKQGAPIVVKADGLAAGKGVLVARTVEEAVTFAKDCLAAGKFGRAGASVVVEDCLVGEEASYLVFTDGKSYQPMVFSQDHKQASEGDKGPNTGGMGAYSPAPVLEGHEEELDGMMQAWMRGIENEGIGYKGVLYAGLMKTAHGLKILEFNCRFGDPEAQVLLPRMESDLLDVMLATVNGRLTETPLRWKPEHCIAVVLASGGYPGKYEKGKPIAGLDEVERASVIHAGTKREETGIVTNGGRVLNVVALGKTLKDAADIAYREIGKLRFDKMYYRRDIGWKELERQGTQSEDVREAMQG